jgi:hypothetical protein
MSNLRIYWEEYKRIELKGERTKRCFELEELIHDEQKNMGVKRYDFNIRWTRKESEGKPTLTGPSLEPTPDEKPVPQSNFTFDYAKDKLGENDFAILEECAMDAEIAMVCLAKILDGLNPDNLRNPARRGQATNLAMRLYEERKNLDK